MFGFVFKYILLIMKTYERLSNVEEFCNETINKIDGHCSIDFVRSYLISMYMFGKQRTWYPCSTYGLKHIIERAAKSQGCGFYCSNNVVKAILYELHYNKMCVLSCCDVVSNTIILNALKNPWWDLIERDDVNLMFKFKNNKDIDI